ncbi:SIR2 family NAD-dependent protein deacylase [Bordetella genomosp. 12]|uniref:protein acetyllysine N-acetyltransferase n=1 Tax=Bordetella genomosp. 12 TaxID=463035 RepID=A0A261VSP8_9BORD|nr:Sir2 family NAD-dependent protein deacetylase [Bordetella genomosp. 12]OZI77128.1 NAD-dependent deacetylase [Bordetella genomosp. 12]
MPESTPASALERAASLISDAYAIVVVAGAGMGIDSGLPDFRGSQGFWNAYPGLRSRKLKFYDIASPSAFKTDPGLAWGFYGHRLALYRATTPHEGFGILRRWIQARPMGGAVFTSNVDGHFQKAGFDAQLVLECHGSIHHLQCFGQCQSGIWSAQAFQPDVDLEHCLLRGLPPSCPSCGRLARPNILMFDDDDWLSQRTDEQSRRLEHWLNRITRPLVIEIGAGTAIATARAFTHRMAFEWSAPVIRINPDDTAIHGNPRHVCLPMTALQALRAIDRCLN